MALSIGAEKLLAWLNIYKKTPGQYYQHLEQHPKAHKKGVFISQFDELLNVYGYQY